MSRIVIRRCDTAPHTTTDIPYCSRNGAIMAKMEVGNVPGTRSHDISRASTISVNVRPLIPQVDALIPMMGVIILHFNRSLIGSRPLM